MATVEDLYRQVLGREPDPAGKAFWESAFGGSVDPAEQASFMQSVQSVLASAPPAQQATLAPKLVAEATAATPTIQANTYFQANPDVAAAYQANSYGLTPELFAGSHYIKYGQYEGRNATPEIVIPPKVDRTLLTTSGVKPVDTSATDVQRDIGFTSNNLGAGLLGASAVAAPPLSQEDIVAKIKNQILAQGTSSQWTGQGLAPPLSQEDIVAKIKNQILAQGTSSQWTGQGLGSPEKNAADMARLLSDAGITDINQFGKVPVFAPVEPIKTLYNGKQVFTETDEAGKTSSYIYEPTGKILTGSYGDGGDYTSPEMRLVTVPKDAKLETVYGVARDSGGEGGSYYEPIDPSKIKTVDGKLVGDTGQTTFGNKLTTKQELTHLAGHLQVKVRQAIEFSLLLTALQFFIQVVSQVLNLNSTLHYLQLQV